MRLTVLVLLLFLTQCKPIQKMNDNSIFHAIRLKPGEDVKQSIDSFVIKNNIKAGWIATCVGSLTNTNLRYANQPEGETLFGHFEIVSLTGTLSVNGSHLHASISDSTGKTIGGHLLKGNRVYTTVEIVIGEFKNIQFTREKDGTTPWEELQITEK
jgi:predicted DNA-binding protein with PD1-like motif